MNLFSESFVFELSDIHIILGPSHEFMSMDEDFYPDPKSCFYDLNDQYTNIQMMHEVVEQTRKEYYKLQKQKKK